MYSLDILNQQIQDLIDGVIAEDEEAILTLLGKYEPLLFKGSYKTSNNM